MITSHPQRSRAYSAHPRRRRPARRPWTRPDQFPGVMAMLAVIPSLPRAQLSRLTQSMIDQMDDIDGDPDLEHLAEDDEDSHDREWTYD